MMGWVGIGLLILAIAALVANLVHQWRQPSMAKRLANARVGLSRSEWIGDLFRSGVPAEFAATMYDLLDTHSGVAIAPHPDDRIRAHFYPDLLDFFALEAALAERSGVPLIDDAQVRQNIETLREWAVAMSQPHIPRAGAP